LPSLIFGLESSSLLQDANPTNYIAIKLNLKRDFIFIFLELVLQTYLHEYENFISLGIFNLAFNQL